MRRIGFIVLKIFISSALLGWLLYQFGMNEIKDLLIQADPGWLFGALALFSLSHILGSLQWHLLLHAESIFLPWRFTLSFYYTGLFFNNFLISGFGGDMFRIVDIRRYSHNGTAAVSTVFLDRILGFFVMTSMALFSFPWILHHSGYVKEFSILMISILCGWVLLLMIMFNKKTGQSVEVVFSKLPFERFRLKVKQIYQNIDKFSNNSHLIVKALVLSVFIQSARIGTHYLLSKSIGADIALIYFFIFIPVIAIITSLPISVGGLGLREQTGVLLFGIIGMAALDASVMELQAYLIAVITSLPGGIMFIARRSAQRYISSALPQEIETG